MYKKHTQVYNTFSILLFTPVATMSFRSLLEAAMGDAQELSQDEVGRIDAQVDLLDDDRSHLNGTVKTF